MTKLDDMNRAAADVVRARKLTRPEHGEESLHHASPPDLRTITRTSRQSPSRVFFREIEICDEVILRSDGFYLVSRRRDPPMDECPF